MRHIYRALAMLALSSALVCGTAAIAAATTQPTPTIDQAGLSGQRQALYRSQLERNLQGRAEQGATDGTEIALSDAERRRIARVPDPFVAPAPVAPAVGADPEAPGGGVGVLATLLLGVVGGLVGGAAAALGWAVSTRRRLPRAAAGA
jgi:hypothetical protein